MTRISKTFHFGYTRGRMVEGMDRTSFAVGN